MSDTIPILKDAQQSSVKYYAFKIMTWNVWFDILEMQARMEHIIDQVLRILPDIACFQEVVPTFADMLRKHRKLKQHYSISLYEPVHNYGNITLARHLATYSIVEFPNSKMGRKLTLAKLRINGISSIPEITVGNVHLESLNNQSKRVEQIKICRDNLPPGSSILTGDFNIGADENGYQKRKKSFTESNKAKPITSDTPPGSTVATASTAENDAIVNNLPGFTDAWLLQVPILHARYVAEHGDVTSPPVLNVTPEDPVWENASPSAPAPPAPRDNYRTYIAEQGYTFDTLRNNMNRSATSERKRIDRIMTSLDPDIFQFQEMRLLGTEAIAVKDRSSIQYSLKSPPRLIFASDHYGLLCTYNIRYSSPPEEDVCCSLS